MAGSSSWSYDTLRENAEKDWTLAGDDQVLRLMMRIGKKLESRTVAVTKQMDEMVVNVDRTCVQLENVNNKLLALQKTHFFDHQIQDDEEYLRPVVPADAVDGKAAGKLSKADADELLKKILKDTVDAVDKCYEKVVLDWSDSILDDDDDVITRTMIRPIDVYKDLPHPYLIGSEKWRNSRFCGLRPEEEEKPQKVDTPVPLPSEGNSQQPVITKYSTPQVVTEDPQVPEESVPVTEHEPAMQSERFFQPPDLSSDFRDFQSKRDPDPIPIVKPQEITSPSVFFDETPPAPHAAAAVRKKPNLFADLEDDDDDVFAVSPTGAVPKALPRGFKPQVNLFDDEPPEMEVRVSQTRNVIDDDVDGEFNREPKKSVPENLLNPGLETKKRVNLFDDDDGEEEDLFAAKKIQRKVDQKKAQQDKVKEDVVNNNNITQEEKSSTLDENKNPVGKVTQNDTFKQSMEEMLRKGFGGANKVKPTSRPTSVDKEPSVEKIMKAPELPPQLPVARPVEAPVIQKLVPKGLFDDLDEDDDEDLFANPSKAVPKLPKQEAVQSVIPKEEIEVKRTTPIRSKGLFDDDEPENDLFGPTPSHLIGTAEVQRPTPIAEPTKDVKSVASKFKSRGLFDDDSDDEEDLFMPKSKPPQSQNQVVKSPIAKKETDEEEDLFGGKPSKQANIVKASLVKSKKASLFDDSEDEDLFSPKKETVPANVQKAEEEEKRRKVAEEKLKKAAEQEEIKRIQEEQEKKRLIDEAALKTRREKEEQTRKQAEEAERKEKEREERQRKLIDEENERKRFAEEEKRQQKILEEEEKDRKIAEEKRKQKILEEEEKERKIQEQKLEQENEQKRIAEEKQRKQMVLEDEERKRRLAEKLEQEKRQKMLEEQAREEQEIRKQIEEQEKEKRKLVEPKKLSLFDDIEDNDEDLFDKPVKVPSKSFTTGLFDEPPEDHMASEVPTKVQPFEDGESSEDDSFFAEKKPTTVTPSTAVKKPISLFSDLPPEDDGDDNLFSSTVKSVKKDVFYDDMAESFPPTAQEELVPADVSLLDDVFAKDSSPVKSKENVQSVRDLIKSHESPVEAPPLSTSPKTRPNKLNTSNIVINVNAFLPGARPPSLSKRKSEDSIEEERVRNETSPEGGKAMDVSSDSINETLVDQNASLNSSVLSNLNKSRVKVTTKRRPSTRKGRQESLRRSQLFESADLPEESVIAEQQEQGAVSVLAEQSMETQKEVAPSIEQAKKEPEKKTRKLFSSDDDEDSDDIFQPKPSVAKVEQQPKKEKAKQISQSLFSDEGDSDGDLFGGSSSTVQNSTTKGNKQPVKKEAPRTSTDHNPLADLF